MEIELELSEAKKQYFSRHLGISAMTEYQGYWKLSEDKADA